MLDLCDLFEQNDFNGPSVSDTFEVEAPIITGESLGVALAAAEFIADEYTLEQEQATQDLFDGGPDYIKTDFAKEVEFVSLKDNTKKKTIAAFEQMVYKDCGLM